MSWRRRWPWVLVGLVGIGLGHKGYTLIVGPTAPAALVTRSELVQKVVASGRVLPPARINIGGTLTAIVERVPVVEGQHVKAGELLLQLQDAVEQATVAQARAGVAQAAAKLSQLQRVGSRVASESLRQADVTLRQAEQRHRRIKALVDKGATSQVELEEAQKGLDLARSQQQSAAIQAASTAALGSEQQFAISALAQARAMVAAAEARLAQTRLVAPSGGVILSRLVEAGDIVQPGRTLLVLARDGATQLAFQPEEKNLSLLRVGQRARASADAFPDDAFDAVIVTIAPSVDAQRGTVEVKLDIPRPPAFLRPDMTVSVDVEVARSPRALVIPAEAVRDLFGTRPWVVAVRHRRAERQQVRLGVRGAGMLEVRSGVTEGEAVLLATARWVKIGQRVRPQLEEAPGAL